MSTAASALGLKGRAAEMAVLGEALDRVASGQAAVVLGVRGILLFELRVRGAGYPVHSGNWGGVAPNPAWAITRL